MKKEKVFIIYLLILLLLGYWWYLLSLALFKFYDKFVFTCSEVVELCWPQLFKSWSMTIISSIIITIFLWFIIFRYFKKYIDQK